MPTFLNLFAICIAEIPILRYIQEISPRKMSISNFFAKKGEESKEQIA